MPDDTIPPAYRPRASKSLSPERPQPSQHAPPPPQNPIADSPCAQILPPEKWYAVALSPEAAPQSSLHSSGQSSGTATRSIPHTNPPANPPHNSAAPSSSALNNDSHRPPQISSAPQPALHLHRHR